MKNEKNAAEIAAMENEIDAAMREAGTDANGVAYNVANSSETFDANESADDKDENGKTLTPEQVKAKQVLRAVLPNLKAANLNFEKRTGNFFTGVIEKVAKLDGEGNPKQRADGSIVYETDEHGKPVEKLRRLVIELTDETGAFKPEYAKAADEINAKRAAALVLDGEKRRARIEAEKVAAEKAVTEAVEKLASFDADMTEAVEIVKATELPEGATREKLADVKARAESAEAKNAAMREKLLALGINPDEL